MPKSFHDEARGFLRQIKDDPNMSESLACIRFSQALGLMIEIHNNGVEKEAQQREARIPTVTSNEIGLLRKAFNGDIDPLIDWLAPRVPYDPTRICGILPK